jgi:tRNA-specific 2-thiouridylase
LEDFAPDLPPPGPILDVQGRQLGQHEGLANFTIGQRKGIGLTSEKPRYVISKDFETNALIIGERHELGRATFIVKNPNWIQGAPPGSDESVLVRVRYKAQEVEGYVAESNAEHATIDLTETLPDITPGQSAVFYSDEECLGGGIIAA